MWLERAVATLSSALRGRAGRWVARRLVPAPGEGPTEAQMEAGFFRFTGALAFNKTRVTKVAATPTQLAALGESIFDRVERGRFEFGQPQNNQIYSVNWTKSAWTSNLRTQRFGKVRTFGLAANGSADNIMQPKWITDVLVEREITKATRLSIGADNIFDVYPTQVITANSNGGTLPFSGFSPFGFNGRHVFARVNYRF